MIPTWYRVQRRVVDTHDTFSLELEAANGEKSIAPFRAGQFNMLYVFGYGEIPISISGDPANPHRLVHTTRAVGRVTNALQQVAESELIGVRGPFGTGWPLAEAEGRDVILVAGGIGLAPLRPVIYHLLNRRDRFGRIIILYGTRTPDDILYMREIGEWRARLDIDFEVTVDYAAGGWHGNTGVVTTLIPRAVFDPHDAIAMICGPEIMMKYTIRSLRERGLQDNEIHVSMERSMKCGVGLCGHCQLGSEFICKDGPVYRYDLIRHLATLREV
jgi:NAD(P)H-flavin reductase